MGNRYFEVLRMYWLYGRRSRGAFFGNLACIVAALGMIPVLILDKQPDGAVATAFICISVLFPSMQWFGFFQEQVLNDRRTHAPRFIRPHIVVFSAMIAIVGAGLPALLIFFFKIPSAAWLLAFIFGSFAVTGLASATGSTIWMFLGFLSYLVFYVAAFSSSARIFVQNLSAAWPWSITATSLPIIVYCIWRIGHLTEEDRAYHVRFTVNRPPQPRMTGETKQRSLRSKQKRFRQPVFISPNAGFFARVRRWRSVTPHGWGLRTIMIAIMMAVVGMVNYVHLTGAFSMLFILLMLSLLPAVSAYLAIMVFRRHSEEESLRPIWRAMLVAEMGAMIAIHAFDIWFACAIVISISGFAGLLPLNASLANDLIASFGVLWLNYGLVVWLSKYRPSSNFSYVFLILALVMSEIVSDAATNNFWAYAVAIVSILIGAVISLNAYEDWQNLEFGR